MRFKIFTALIVVSVVLMGWPGIGRACGMSCCAPSAGAEVQFTGELPGCCCCGDDMGSCGWERAAHKRTPIAAHTAETPFKPVRTAKAVVAPVFLQVLISPKASSFGQPFGLITGPPGASDRTTLLQVMLC